MTATVAVYPLFVPTEMLFESPSAESDVDSIVVVAMTSPELARMTVSLIVTAICHFFRRNACKCIAVGQKVLSAAETHVNVDKTFPTSLPETPYGLSYRDFYQVAQSRSLLFSTTRINYDNTKQKNIL